MPLVNIASASPVAIRLTDVPAPGGDFGYIATIVGNRNPDALNGLGISYDIDQATFEAWCTAHPDQAASLRTITQAEIDQLAALQDDPRLYGFEQGAQPPVTIDVPYASQSGGTLNVTMGNWVGMASGSYSYQWSINGSAVGTNSANYTVTPDDVGGSAQCTVTASNAFGSTAAPPSNAVVVA